MIKALEKYSGYINLSLAERIKFIKQAKTDPNLVSPIPGATQKFSEEDFVYLSVFNSKKAEQLYKLKTYREQCVSGKPKAVVNLFHGLKSHMNRGVNLAKYFATRDIVTVGYDYRGFGQSQGLSGVIQSAETHLADGQKFMRFVKEMYPNIPHYGVGLSLGGATAYHLSRRHRQMFDATVLMAPALSLSAETAPKFSTYSLLASLFGWAIPNSYKVTNMKYEDNCRNANYAKYCTNDEHYLKEGVKFVTIVALKQFMGHSKQTFPEYDRPFMVVQGGCDKIIDPQVAFDLYSMSKTPEEEKEILFYERMFHDVWHEPEIEQIQEKVADWILARASSFKSK